MTTVNYSEMREDVKGILCTEFYAERSDCFNGSIMIQFLRWPFLDLWFLCLLQTCRGYRPEPSLPNVPIWRGQPNSVTLILARQVLGFAKPKRESYRVEIIEARIGG